MKDLLNENQLHPKQMLANLNEFAEKIAQLASDIGINPAGLEADHIALRIHEQEIAMLAHESWLDYGSEISSANINGRPIIVIEFEVAPIVGQWSPECLEMPYPAPGKIYPQQGWEHIEFVIESDAQTAEAYLEDLKEKIPGFGREWDNLAEKGIKTKLSSPKGEGERLANPTVAFKRDGVCIKLHPHSLKEVVLSEK